MKHFFVKILTVYYIVIIAQKSFFILCNFFIYNFLILLYNHTCNKSKTTVFALSTVVFNISSAMVKNYEYNKNKRNKNQRNFEHFTSTVTFYEIDGRV